MVINRKKKPGIALVAEGGGMRGIFCAGVLDVLMEQKCRPFDLYIGVSAGACNLASHLGGQHQRNFRIYTRIMTRPEFISMKKFLSGSHMMDLDYLWNTIDIEDPLAVTEIYRDQSRDFIVVGSSVETGKPVYMQPRPEDCSMSLKASSAVPLLYRGFLEINGIKLVDGGVTDPIPVMEAYRRGARRIVVIRTRPALYRKSKGLEHYLSSFATRKWPELSRAVKNQACTYGRCVDFILNPPADVEIIQIAPDAPLKCSRTTQEKELLLSDYALGRKHGEMFARSWK
ncbi:MAG TPA: patatin family protein [Spirochaetota bacterium]|nr:patatin family protein [Spirochaetota bacterium]HPN11311.1 patatin family protein [Spirochaetota bacterium]HQL81930.1 patatin family protein [Spirochaetota bacterium]